MSYTVSVNILICVFKIDFSLLNLLDCIIEEVEESLSLAEKEKEFIIKALEKHRNKRKNAAKELGISERTLYRKIKEYDIQ